MLVEIHVLQNHAPANLNRDDTGSPKDCLFGGIRRARISSQCLKRSIRRSPVFLEDLDGLELAVRTRRLPVEVQKLLLARGLSEDLAEVAATKATGFGTKEGKEQKAPRTAQTMFLSPGDMGAIADVLYDAAVTAGSVKDFVKLSTKDLQAAAELHGWRPLTPDISLFGRMITSEAFRDVESAIQVAHALSTNKMDHEFDYYTAVDDLQALGEEDEKGADMIGDVEYTSACFYKYFSLDVDGLVENLAGPKPNGKGGDDTYEGHLVIAREVASRVVTAFLRAAVFTTPSGKQNTFAAYQLPDAVLVECRPVKIPVSYANAFLKPARARGDVDLMDDSLAKFVGHAEMLTKKFSLQASTRLWFSTRDVALDGTLVCGTFDDLLAGLRTALAGEGAHV
jgi:CRISPR system Cascade subunit CasC